MLIMKREELIETIIKAIKENSDAEEITESSSFMDDLEMSSMEIYAFIGDLEAEIHISIPQNVLNKAATVDELANEIIELI